MASSSRRVFVIGAGAMLGAVGAAARAQSGAAQGELSASRLDLNSAGEPLRRLYADGAEPLWSDRSADALALALRTADAHGLDPAPYLSLIEQSPTGGGRDINLSRAALAYAGALARGLVNPSDIFEIYTLPRDQPDLAEGLKAALAQQTVGPWLSGLAPQDAQYAALSAAYIDLAGQARSPQAPPVPPGPLIRPGESDQRRPAIIAALVREGAAGPDTPAEGAVWSQADAEMLKSYQRSRGLREDGIVGPNTLAMLNVSPHDKARRVAVNLERLRWLQRAPPATRIDVNTAASTLSYIVDGQTAGSALVVTGRAGHETPQLQASFEQLVVNPPWHVPASIARREIEPKGDAYLARNHMRRIDGRIVQSPGPWAALGQVKFDMQNPYAIYLHDTPSKAMFARSQRHLSHGCVRVDQAVEFARRLAASSGVAERFDRILESGQTGVVPLAAAIPVRLIYQTALIGDAGAVTFRPDVYGWDVRTAEAMGLVPPDVEGVEPITAAPIGP